MATARPASSNADCSTDERQPSRIPGNIGTLNSRVMVWDHDPLWARATQNYSWPFSKATGEQHKDTVPSLLFEIGDALLTPVYKPHDMFVCTINPQKAAETAEDEVGPPNPGVTTAHPGVDFVGSPESGVGEVARPKMPGGDLFECSGVPCLNTDPTTGRDIFPHQVWKYVGSLLNPTVFVHPSEYPKLLAEYQNKNLPGGLHSAPWFDYKEEIDNGKSFIMPYQKTKHSPGSDSTTHWTLEKWTPLWQGEDFSVTIKIGDKKTNDAIDPNDGTVVDTTIEDYKYLMYEESQNPPFDFVKGISNQAFHVFAAKDQQGHPIEGAQAEALRAARVAFD